MKLLSEHFVSSWSLMVDLQAHAADNTLPYSSLAQSFIDVYEFPVLMSVSLSNGTIVHKINANDFLDMEANLIDHGLANPSVYNYVLFLKEGLKKAEAAMKQG